MWGGASECAARERCEGVDCLGMWAGLGGGSLQCSMYLVIRAPILKLKPIHSVVSECDVVVSEIILLSNRILCSVRHRSILSILFDEI